jgi:hypothetical protein
MVVLRNDGTTLAMEGQPGNSAGYRSAGYRGLVGRMQTQRGNEK